MKQQVFYIHGGESYTEYSYFIDRLKSKEIWDLPIATRLSKWSKTFAEDLGDEYEVFMPQMPNAQNAKYMEWKIWFERHFKYLHNDLILSGCSLGAMFLIKYLTENVLPVKVKNLILLAAAVEPTKEPDDSGDFFADLDKLALLPDRVDKVTIMHSKDDFLVPYEHAVKLNQAIPGSLLVTFEDKNHFLVSEFPELVAHIKGLG